MPVVASFTALPTRGNVPFGVQFTNTSSGGSDKYVWDFGDGIYSDETNPYHVYTTDPVVEGAGYTVTLRAWIDADATPISAASYITSTTRDTSYWPGNSSTGWGSDQDHWDYWVANNIPPYSGYGTSTDFNFSWIKFLTGNSSSWGRQSNAKDITDLDIDLSSYAESTHMGWIYIDWGVVNAGAVFDGGDPVKSVAAGFPNGIGNGSIVVPSSSSIDSFLIDYVGLFGTNWTGASIKESSGFSRRLAIISYWLDPATGVPHQTKGFAGSLVPILYSFPSGASFNSASIVVGPPFVANFSGTPRTGFDPLVVQFTDLSGPLPTNHQWDFGDNSPVGTTTNPSHTYTFEACDEGD